jgi:hypothetical protein
MYKQEIGGRATILIATLIRREQICRVCKTNLDRPQGKGASRRAVKATATLRTDRCGLTGVKYWEIIPDDLSKAGLELGVCIGGGLSRPRTIWIADAHRDGQRFIVRADEKLTALVELESATH